MIPGAIGLSSSTVSRGFVQGSAAKLREMQERDPTGEDAVALFLDGKTFAEATMVVALGITLCGEKRFLGFVETDTENAQVLTPFLRSLLERGLDISQGLLVIIGGGKGLQAAVKKAFRKRARSVRPAWSCGSTSSSRGRWPRPSTTRGNPSRRSWTIRTCICRLNSTCLRRIGSTRR